MTFVSLPPESSGDANRAATHPLLTLAAAHLQQATDGLMTGRFNPMRELRDPKRMLVVYRKRYGHGVLGDEYFVAAPTYVQGPRAGTLQAGETIVLDFDGTPAVARIEGMLYRALLQHDRDAQALVSRHLAHHATF